VASQPKVAPLSRRGKLFGYHANYHRSAMRERPLNPGLRQRTSSRARTYHDPRPASPSASGSTSYFNRAGVYLPCVASGGLVDMKSVLAHHHFCHVPRCRFRSDAGCAMDGPCDLAPKRAGLRPRSVRHSAAAFLSTLDRDNTKDSRCFAPSHAPAERFFAPPGGQRL